MGGEEVKAVCLEVGEEGREDVAWLKLLPRASVRVLLVEGDDCTRQIITALLRKCGYRVTTASDGLKACEILREKEHNIDLVLTEVELPKMSGVDLLTMMMDQDCCNHIPVIMMSSNDSISIAFNCLIKGASDFLVKPIRKNELTNLWQHVWRKQKGEIKATQKKKVDLAYDQCCIENATDKQDDKDCCEKESDALSSCTRSEMEVESTCKLGNTMVLKQAQSRNFSLLDETQNPDNHFEKQLDGISLFPNDEENGVISSGSDIQPELKKSISIPSLELSLDGYPHIMPNRQQNDESNTLHHSKFSAFSLYNNNSKVVPKLSKQTSFQAENKECSNNCMEPPPPPPPPPPPHQFMDGAVSGQAGRTFRCTPIRCIPFPVAAGVSFDNTRSNVPVLQSMLYPQSAQSLWTAMPSILHEAYTENLPHQSAFNDFKSVQCHRPDADQRHVSSTVTGDSGSVCNDISRYMNVESGSTFDICEGIARSGDEDCFHTLGQIKPADTYQLMSQREAALTKFRLKRKERCFEKKVRYLSRKKLAEQRPRVKGQFVRQV